VVLRLLLIRQGGLNTVLWLNEQPICTSSNIYGRTAQSVDPLGKQHISDVSVCTNLGKIGKGDLVHITSVYDSVQHAFDDAMPKNGFEYIMAINNVRMTRAFWLVLTAYRYTLASRGITPKHRG
jgi:hypothetical protein